jgi:cytidine deaminase
VLNELAQAGGTDPVIWCGESAGEGEPEMRLSDLLPHAFGPSSLT